MEDCAYNKKMLYELVILFLWRVFIAVSNISKTSGVRFEIIHYAWPDIVMIIIIKTTARSGSGLSFSKFLLLLRSREPSYLLT